MAKITTTVDWSVTLPQGTYDIQKLSHEGVYLNRGTSTPTSIDGAMLINTALPIRITVKAGDTAYFYGYGIDILYYLVE